MFLRATNARQHESATNDCTEVTVSKTHIKYS
jgi:hypothetical protein